MNKKGEGVDILHDSFVHIVFIALFFAVTLGIIYQFSHGAVFWEEYYAKDIAKIVNFAEAGDEICINVHSATEIAIKNEVGKSEIFKFDNLKNEVCVRLSKGRVSCYSYFNEYDVVNYELKLADAADEKGNSINRACFDIAEKAARENV